MGALTLGDEMRSWQIERGSQLGWGGENYSIVEKDEVGGGMGMGMGMGVVLPSSIV